MGSVASDMPEGLELEFTLLEFGIDGTTACDNGDEFNPLEEKYNGVSVMYQDPARGRIGSITLDAMGDGTLDQNKFLQNLRGKNGILGKAIRTNAVIESVDTVLACCIIGEDMPPMAAAPADPAPVEPQPHQHT